MPSRVALDASTVELVTLTTYACGPRYVLDAGSDAEEPTWEEAAQAVGIAVRILALARAHRGVPDA